MSKNYSKWLELFGLSVWVVLGTALAQIIMLTIVSAFVLVGVSFKAMPTALVAAGVAAVFYVLALVIVVGLPIKLKKSKFKFSEFKLKGLMTWRDIGLALAGLVVYMVFAASLLYLTQVIFPSFDINQAQQNGFENGLHEVYQYFLALITLVIIAPVAEEMLFRGYFFGKLRKKFPFWISAVVVSLIFGLIHGAWNVGIDVFALSLVLCYLRETTDSIWSPIILHMTKNGIAYFALFIYPLL